MYKNIYLNLLIVGGGGQIPQKYPKFFCPRTVEASKAANGNGLHTIPASVMSDVANFVCMFQLTCCRWLTKDVFASSGLATVGLVYSTLATSMWTGLAYKKNKMHRSYFVFFTPR